MIWHGRPHRRGTRRARSQGAEAGRRQESEGSGAHGPNKVRAIAMTEGADLNSEDMAELLGVSLPTLRNWMAPADNMVHWEMPKTATLLLARTLADE